MMGVLFVIGWPLAKMLDCLLGHESGAYFRRTELSELVQFHMDATGENEDPLNEDEARFLQGTTIRYLFLLTCAIMMTHNDEGGTYMHDPLSQSETSLFSRSLALSFSPDVMCMCMHIPPEVQCLSRRRYFNIVLN